MQAVRLDSGDLVALSKEVRHILDEAGRQDVQIVASGDLNEEKIRALVLAAAPIDVFGVGTELVTSRDDPSLNTVYKLVEQETAQGVVGRFKLSRDKKTYPYTKQVYRWSQTDGTFERDVIARVTEHLPGEPLLVPVLRDGELVAPLPPLDECRAHCREQRRRLPLALLALERCSLYPLHVSEGLEEEFRQLVATFA